MNLVFLAVIVAFIEFMYHGYADSEHELHSHKKLTVCDNFITRNIPGGREAVRDAANAHYNWLRNDSNAVTPFAGAWKYEFERVLDKIRLPTCTDMKIFGTTYDERKYFCSPPEQLENCNAYSLGGNDQWEFEEKMFAETKCNISTFDCSVEATVPKAIESRTKFYHSCVGTENRTDFVAMHNLGSITGAQQVEYLKIDIEGYEWPMLNGMVDSWMKDPLKVDPILPLQMFIEFHPDRSSDRLNYVDTNLRHFFTRLFRVGYMIMFHRPTVQSRNKDALIVKVLCYNDLFP